ncbi:hypothetical protein [Piscirickettsia salmonis]|nr:hypothetical protein [Piscirickettsia salmonis]QGP58643.1 hypothetical protein PsalBI1_01219 [Piscirickettsia salmonis]
MQLPINTLYNTILLEAINFNTVSKLVHHFNSSLTAAIDSTTETENPSNQSAENPFRSFKAQLEQITATFLKKLNLFYHPQAFKQLDNLSLGNQPLCIQEILENHHNLDQCHPSLTEVYKKLEEILSDINAHLLTQSLTSHSSASTSTQSPLSCFSLTCLRPQAINPDTIFNQYQKNMVHALFSYYTAKEKTVEQLRIQLSQYETEFLAASNLKSNYPDFQSPCARLLSKINIQANQSPSSQLLFTYQQQTETPDFAIAERKTHIPLPK